MKHPMQPMIIDKYRCVRFQDNAIVRHLLDVASAAGTDLNRLACMNFDAADHMQLAQLIGYSVSGFGDLSYASAEVVALADAASTQLVMKGDKTPVEDAVDRLRALYEEGDRAQKGDLDWNAQIEWQAQFVIACFEELPHLFAAAARGIKP